MRISHDDDDDDDPDAYYTVRECGVWKEKIIPSSCEIKILRQSEMGMCVCVSKMCIRNYAATKIPYNWNLCLTRHSRIACVPVWILL